MSRASRLEAGCVATLDTGRLDSLEEGMNDPEVIMLDALPTSNLIAHRKALEGQPSRYLSWFVFQLR